MYTKRSTVLILACVLALRAEAQEPTKLPAVVVKAPVEKPGPKAVAGVVRDTFAIGIDSVEVSIPSLQRRIFTGDDGRFRLANIRAGKYSIRARKIGYAPQIQELVVDDSGGVATFDLLPLTRALAPIVTSAARGGLSGVVGDTAYRAIANAEVRVLGHGDAAYTDSLGHFFFPLKAGQYVVAVRRAGFVEKLVSVTIPPDSGRSVTMFLPPRTTAQSVREAWNVQDFGERLGGRTKQKSTLYTHEDLLKSGYDWLYDAVQHGAGAAGQVAVVPGQCWAVLNGGPKGVVIDRLTADEVESVEIYPTGTASLNLMRSEAKPSNPVGVKHFTGSQRGLPLSGQDEASFYNFERKPPCPIVYVWTR